MLVLVLMLLLHSWDREERNFSAPKPRWERNFSACHKRNLRFPYSFTLQQRGIANSVTRFPRPIALNGLKGRISIFHSVHLRAATRAKAWKEMWKLSVGADVPVGWLT